MHEGAAVELVPECGSDTRLGEKRLLDELDTCLLHVGPAPQLRAFLAMLWLSHALGPKTL